MTPSRELFELQAKAGKLPNSHAKKKLIIGIKSKIDYIWKRKVSEKTAELFLKEATQKYKQLLSKGE